MSQEIGLSSPRWVTYLEGQALLDTSQPADAEIVQVRFEVGADQYSSLLKLTIEGIGGVYYIPRGLLDEAAKLRAREVLKTEERWVE